MHPPTAVALRRGVLAVSVLHDVDVEPCPNGLRLPGRPPVEVSWTACRRALAGRDPETDAGHTRLAQWLLARRWAADAGPARLAAAVRPVGLPVGHLLHPGLGWVCRRVLGDVLDLGLGAVGLDPADPDRVVLMPTEVLDACGLDAAAAWVGAAAELERLGALAVERLRRDGTGVLRPLGDADVLTLLGSRALRTALAAEAGGMAAVVAPMRRRGWTRLGLLDAAFGPAAAAATDAADRGFVRPLLLTPDEVALVPAGGRPQELALRDPAVDTWQRDVLYR